MNNKTDLQISVIEELHRREAISDEAIANQIAEGEIRPAIEDMIFFTAPTRFGERLHSLIARLDGLGKPDNTLRFLVSLTLALRSCLPIWNLSNRTRHGEDALTSGEIEALADLARLSAIQEADRFLSEARLLLESLRRDAEARYRAEEAADPDARTCNLIGNNIADYLVNLSAEIAESNLHRIARMRNAGETVTEIGNDYAAFLDHALLLGASFCTTNPPLVDMAWTALPEKWNPIIEQLIAEHPNTSDEELGRLVTLEIVLDSMTLLRPIFLLSNGDMGRVCLQVNPKNHGNPEAMIRDALFFHRHLIERLDGGAPNVLFKIPGTHAGLETARTLTAQGIGVTITVNFGMYQHLPFAEAIAQGSAPWSCLVVMNGRLAFPVRDELLARLDALQPHGISESQAREAAAWAGVAVARKLQRHLMACNSGHRKIRSLIASLRIYEGKEYENLPSPYPDVTEVLGADIISVFPNVRGPFDRFRPCAMHPSAISDPIPEHVLETLAHSEIFCQAYCAPEGMDNAEEDLRFRPQVPLTLENEDAVAAWPPNKQTLDQFCAAYDAFIDRIRACRERVRKSRC